MFEWRRGATFTMGLRVTDGTVDGSEVVTCWLKPARYNKSPGDDVDPVVTFTTAYVAASGADPAHWLFTGTALQGEGLAVGSYIADARIEIGGSVIQTESVLINVVERVTEDG